MARAAKPRRNKTTPIVQSEPGAVSPIVHNQDAHNVAAEWLDPKSLRGWARNPRDNEAAVHEVAESIRRFGFGSPIVARAENREVIAGHTRLAAAQLLGLDRVPVRLLDLSESEAHSLALADNRLGGLAEWDLDKLRGLGDELDLAGLGFDLPHEAEVEVKEVEVSELRAEFFLVANGPLPAQPEVLNALRDALGRIEGVTVSVTTTAHAY